MNLQEATHHFMNTIGRLAGAGDVTVILEDKVWWPLVAQVMSENYSSDNPPEVDATTLIMVYTPSGKLVFKRESKA